MRRMKVVPLFSWNNNFPLESIMAHCLFSISNLFKCFIFNKVLPNHSIENYNPSFYPLTPISLLCFIFPFYLWPSNIRPILLFYCFTYFLLPTNISSITVEIVTCFPVFFFFFKVAFPTTKKYLAQSRYSTNICKMNEKFYFKWKKAFKTIINSCWIIEDSE